MIVGIHDVDAVVLVDEESGRQIEVSRGIPASAEVVKQLAFAIEGLDHAPKAVHDVQTVFTVERNALRTEHAATVVARVSDGVMEFARAAEHLYPEIHGIDHGKLLIRQLQLGREVEFAIAAAVSANLLQNIAPHIHHEDLVT